MTRRLAIATFIAINLVVLAATAVAAKGEGVAKLAAPLPRDAEPGSTITVHWTLSSFVDENGATGPFSAQGAYIKLVGSEITEAFGTETPLGSGNYVAEIIIPAGGIRDAEFGISGTSTINGQTTRSDMPFAFQGVLLQAAVPPAVKPNEPPANPATTPTTEHPVPAPSVNPLFVLGVLALGLGAVRTFLTLRRRTALA
jgi:hypothetical protein